MPPSTAEDGAPSPPVGPSIGAGSAAEAVVEPPPTTADDDHAARVQGAVAAQAPEGSGRGGGSATCQGCGHAFGSRNAVFKHLVDTQGACLDPSELDEFRRHVLNQRRIKVLLLVGYAVELENEGVDEGSGENGLNRKSVTEGGVRIHSGDDAASVLQDALVRYLEVDPSDATGNDLRLIRAYGHACRGTDVTAQDPHTGALTEVVAVRLPPIAQDPQCVQRWIDGINETLVSVLHDATSTAAVQVLGRIDLPPSAHKFNPEMDFSHRRVEFLLPVDFFWPPPETHRHALLGNDDDGDGADGGIDSNDNHSTSRASLQNFFTQIFSFDDGANVEDEDKDHEESAGSVQPQVHYSRSDVTLLGVSRPSREVLLYMHSLKKKMQRLTTQVEKLDFTDSSALKAKEYSQQKRQNNRTFQEQSRKVKKQNKNNKRPKKEPDDEGNHMNGDETTGTNVKENGAAMEGVNETQQDDSSNGKSHQAKKTRNRGNKGTHVLRRKRFHNFTPFVMAHEFLAFRRLDRFYHRASLRFQPGTASDAGSMRLMSSNSKDNSVRPFFLLSLSGDLFLTGQAPRIIGLFLAMARGAIDDDIVDCVFDEKYPHLVPTPPAPLFAMCSGDAFFTKWEGKLKTILTPRVAEHFTSGWNDRTTLRRVREWTVFLRERTAQAWMRGGVVGPGDDRLVLVQQWVDDVLQPWAVRAREQLKDYRQWKATSNGACNGETTATVAESDAPVTDAPAISVPVGTATLPPLESVDPTVPPLFEKVLYYLRQADASGLWPSTTPKRQLVMISTVKEGHKDHGDPATASSLAQALERAQSSQAPDTESRASAYIFEEGQGGASGSFSVGAMPDGQSSQPRANAVFPQLMKAAFELELALRPDREPSSTIAINRNAQFRPHTDSGAGAGQSTSLIVGLGTYAGGELVVEGEMVDIRYKAREFNGWKQRHWTMPFVGERYSLVWFTPKGCEGVRGIDLCKEIVLD